MAIWDDLKPQPLWRLFGELVAIGRPSKHEAAAGAWVEDWAKERGYATTRDAAGNLAVFVPARGGAAGAPPVIIQTHLDIVVADDTSAPEPVDSARGVIPVRRGRSTETGRFEEDPAGDWIGAPWSTLGADNGIGCAMAMSVAEDPDAVHPPLELLFTTDEEQGMTGALQLDPDALKLQGRTLINLDTEDDDELTIGCAGGTDATVRLPVERTEAPPTWCAMRVSISGLRGGHSGVEIHAGRANAIRLLAQALRNFASGHAVHLAALSGGEKRNAIPRSAQADLLIAPDDRAALEQSLHETAEAFAPLYAGRDEPLRFAAEEIASPRHVLAREATRIVLDLLVALPHGVHAVTAEIPDLVETSDNLAVVQLEGSDVVVHCNVRSSLDAGMNDLIDQIEAAAKLAGGTVTTGGRYPGWKPNLDSPLLASTQAAYEELFGAPPKVSAIHAGLECGVLSGKFPGLDAISFGPNIRGNHAPGEHVQISSVAKSYRLLKATLARLAQA